jgi:hypothetical protein
MAELPSMPFAALSAVDSFRPTHNLLQSSDGLRHADGEQSAMTTPGYKANHQRAN